MATKSNAAQVAVQAEPCQKSARQAMDMHAMYREQAAAGYTRDLTLRASEVQAVTARLRGMEAISAVLIAGLDNEALKLGAWMRGGLVEAMHALAADAYQVLERNDTSAQKGGAA